MANVNNLKKGIALKIDNNIFLVVEFQHVKPGKGAAFVRTKLKNAKTGAIIDRTFRGGEKVEDIFIEEKTLEYLYADGENYVFMDHTTYDQVNLSKNSLGNGVKLLKEGAEIKGRFHDEELIQLSFPSSMQFEIISTEPGDKGNTASGNALKPAKIETGAEINVPLFVNEGDIIEINTENLSYTKRVNL